MAKTTAPALPAGITREMALTLLRSMVTQRAVDTRGFQLNRQGKVAIAMGSEGHEAVQAGTGLAFVRGKDLLYPYYRNTGLILACGFPLVDLFRSQFARKTDRTAGRSIINHITARDLGIASTSSIIAAHLPHAVGAAWAVRARGEHDRAVFAQFGEGATSEGEWHEAVNFAAVQRLPIVFFIENNGWAISTPQSVQMAVTDVASKAIGYGIPGTVCDGLDPIVTYLAVKDALDRARSGGGPSIVEAKVFRFLSHSTDDDDRTYRDRTKVEQERERDPVPMFERALLDAGVIDDGALKTMKAEVLRETNEATDTAEASPPPDARELYINVYEGAYEPWL